MDTFLEKLLAGGPGYVVEKTKNSAGLKPVSRSDQDLAAFQSTADAVFQNVGNGYSIVIDHFSDDHAERYCDNILIEFDQEGDI
jgi:hypothetical protein